MKLFKFTTLFLLITIFIAGCQFSEAPGETEDEETRIGEIDERLQYLENLFAGTTRQKDTITFRKVNIQIVSGAGKTDGTVNGLGNLIIGYNEERSSNNNKSGSHNIVVGTMHNYSSYGGLVVGYHNSIAGIYATISGGTNSTASGEMSSISGGWDHLAMGHGSSISGGASNSTTGMYSSISGGVSNVTDGNGSTVGGGDSRRASGKYDWVAGTLFEEQ